MSVVRQCFLIESPAVCDTCGGPRTEVPQDLPAGAEGTSRKGSLDEMSVCRGPEPRP